jgi:hypothetical protein
MAVALSKSEDAVALREGLQIAQRIPGEVYEPFFPEGLRSLADAMDLLVDPKAPIPEKMAYSFEVQPSVLSYDYPLYILRLTPDRKINSVGSGEEKTEEITIKGVTLKIFPRLLRFYKKSDGQIDQELTGMTKWDVRSTLSHTRRLSAESAALISETETVIHPHISLEGNDWSFTATLQGGETVYVLTTPSKDRHVFRQPVAEFCLGAVPTTAEGCEKRFNNLCTAIVEHLIKPSELEARRPKKNAKISPSVAK